jgi:hypothetical protein
METSELHTLDSRIAHWRSVVGRGAAVEADDLDELESHLREQAAELVAAGLDEEEAFLIAVKRLGQVDALTAEFAREHSDRLWKQLVLAPEETGDRRRGVIPLVAFALTAAILIQLGRFGAELSADTGSASWFLRDLGLFVLPVLIGYLVYLRRVPLRPALVLAGLVVALAVVVTVFPFTDDAATGILVGIHLPVVLWFLVGLAYVGPDWRSPARRMDFIRFSGEWAIYLVLIVLGGGVLYGLTSLIVDPIAPQLNEQLPLWLLPSGGAAAVVVAAWLVEAKKSVIENIAPVLTAIFTPLFAVMLVVASIGYVALGVGREFDRDLMTVFDVLLLVVLGLVLYGLSARVESRSSRVMDVIRLAAVLAALLLDILVLSSMLARVGELGLTPNRAVALGLNILLVVNLLGAAVLAVRALAGRVPASHLERWQTGYLPVFAGWTLAVVVIAPVVFGFA